MLLTITPNPALDRTLVIPGMLPGGVYRAERVLAAAGGKGLNVARAAHTLGQPLRVCGPLAGLTGRMVVCLARQEGLECRWSWYEGGETRTCVLVVDPQADDATALNEPGQPLQPSDWQNFVRAALEAAQGAQLVTISGSLPLGVAPDELASLVHALNTSGQRVIVDTSGAALHHVLNQASADRQTMPYGLKVNSSELSAVLDAPVNDLSRAAEAVRELRRRGITLPIVSLGAQGAMAASEEGVCHVVPPTLKIISTVGSGDSLLAGLVVGLLRGETLTEALRLGVACGSANALTIGGGLIDPVEVARIRHETRAHLV